MNYRKVQYCGRVLGLSRIEARNFVFISLSNFLEVSLRHKKGT